MAEELNKPYRYRTFNSYENPIYYKYMDNYLNILGEAYAKIKFFSANVLVSFEYKLHKDGTISDLKIDSLSAKLSQKKIRKLLEDNLPPKFYNGMNEEYVNIEVDFRTNRDFDVYTIDYFGESKNSTPPAHFSFILDRKI